MHYEDLLQRAAMQISPSLVNETDYSLLITQTQVQESNEEKAYLEEQIQILKSQLLRERDQLQAV